MVDEAQFRKNLRIVRAARGLTGDELSKAAKLKSQKRAIDIEEGRVNANKKGSRQIHLRMTLSEYDKIPDDPDIFDDDEEQQEEPDYYYCNCCGYSCVTDHGSWGCPRCTAIMEAQYY